MLQDASTPTENSASGLGASDEFSSSLEGKLMLDVATWRKAPKISSDQRWAKADKDVGKKPAAHCTNKGFRNVCCGLEWGLNCKASWVRGKCSKIHPLQPKTLLPVWVHQMNSVQAWKASWCWMLPYDAKHPRSVPSPLEDLRWAKAETGLGWTMKSHHPTLLQLPPLESKSTCSKYRLCPWSQWVLQTEFSTS